MAENEGKSPSGRIESTRGWHFGAQDLRKTVEGFMKGLKAHIVSFRSCPDKYIQRADAPFEAWKHPAPADFTDSTTQTVTFNDSPPVLRNNDTNPGPCPLVLLPENI
jgi:hypothetical protein